MLSPEDRFAIDDLYARFADAVARQCADDLRPLFTSDATVEGPTEPPRVGTDAIVAAMAAGFAHWDVLLLVPQSLLVLDHEPVLRTRWYVGSTILGATSLAQLEEDLAASATVLDAATLADIAAVQVRYPNPSGY